MENGFIAQYRQLFGQAINCTEEGDSSGIPIGVTRRGEINDFTDAMMQDWTQQADQYFSPVAPSVPTQQQQLFLYERFCTYSEFEQLHTRQLQAPLWSSPVFRLLGITDAAEREKQKKRFPQNREGYFNLMEIMNKEMFTFFFRALQN